jgi:hypothetical protein
MLQHFCNVHARVSARFTGSVPTIIERSSMRNDAVKLLCTGFALAVVISAQQQRRRGLTGSFFFFGYVSERMARRSIPSCWHFL